MLFLGNTHLLPRVSDSRNDIARALTPLSLTKLYTSVYNEETQTFERYIYICRGKILEMSFEHFSDNFLS